MDEKFSIVVVDDDEFQRTPGAGRPKEPLPPELVEVVQKGFADKKVRAVVMPDDNVTGFIYRMRKVAKELNVTVEFQQKPHSQGYTKVVFKVRTRILKPRKES